MLCLAANCPYTTDIFKQIKNFHFSPQTPQTSSNRSRIFIFQPFRFICPYTTEIFKTDQEFSFFSLSDSSDLRTPPTSSKQIKNFHFFSLSDPFARTPPTSSKQINNFYFFSLSDPFVRTPLTYSKQIKHFHFPAFESLCRADTGHGIFASMRLGV
jgi:hypothetical protein